MKAYDVILFPVLLLAGSNMCRASNCCFSWCVLSCLSAEHDAQIQYEPMNAEGTKHINARLYRSPLWPAFLVEPGNSSDIQMVHLDSAEKRCLPSPGSSNGADIDSRAAQPVSDLENRDIDLCEIMIDTSDKTQEVTLCILIS